MTWTCITCFDSGSSTSTDAITDARIRHIQENPECGTVVIQWPDSRL